MRALVLVLLLTLAGSGAAFALTEAEADCCAFMLKMAFKYQKKHYKLVNKCTSKMNLSSDPNSESCQEKFDPKTGDTDFVIDRFKPKFLAKMKKKCIKLLGLSDASFVTQLSIPSCQCGSEIFLSDQMDCMLVEEAATADDSVCVTSPQDMNVNRAAQPPPGVSSFCTGP
ncbi:MAG: hypothetical protein ACE5FG_03540 [Myxococcota bacterium]